jgi:lysophospholipase L1-like esterase
MPRSKAARVTFVGPLAQLARAPRLHRGGHPFEPDTAHYQFENMRYLFIFFAACLWTSSQISAADKPAADLPRILIIGDSISIGYTPIVKKLLDGKAIVEHNKGNAADTKTGVANIEAWLGDGKWDVIHFNFGLHDIKIGKDNEHQVPVEQYEKNLRSIVGRLKKTNAKLIWASTTPVPEGPLSPPRRVEDVPAYNAVAKKIMEENGIPIDDLYALVLPQEAQIQLPKNVHFKDYTPLARQVADEVMKKAKEGK